MPTAVAVVGLAVGAYGAKKSYDAAKDAQRRQDQMTAEQKMLDEEHAKNIKEQAAWEAKKIRAEAVIIRGKQVAAQAHQGVMVGNGSTQAMVDETTRLAEQDAYITLYNGDKGYLKAMEEGRLRQMEGRARATAYGDRATASLLSGISNTAMNAYSLMT